MKYNMVSVPCAKIYKNDNSYSIKKFDGKFINDRKTLLHKIIFTMMQWDKTEDWCLLGQDAVSYGRRWPTL
jgi:hypothetical protein